MSDNGPAIAAEQIDWEKEYWKLLKVFSNLGLTIQVQANNMDAAMQERVNPELKRQRESQQQQNPISANN